MRYTSVTIVSTLFVIIAIAGTILAGNNEWSASGPFGGATGSFLILPQTPGIVLTSGDTIYRSTNGGANWTPTELPGGMVLQAHPQTGEIFAAADSVFHSTNQGASWQLAGNNSFQRAVAFDIALDPTNPQVLYAATNDRGVYKSTNGGRSWQPKNSGLNPNPGGSCDGDPNIEIDPKNGNNLYALYRGCQAYKSTNGGGTWSKIGNGLSFDTRETGLVIDPSNPQVLYIGGGAGIFKTTNGGASWTSTNCRCLPEDLTLDPKNPQNIYGAGQGLLKSPDGGKSWREIALPRPTAYLSGIGAYGNTVFASAYSSGIYRSLNGGLAWKEQDQGINNYAIVYMAMNASRPTVLFGGDGSSLYKTANGGQTWTRILSAQDLGAGDVKIHPQNPNLIVFSSYSGIAGISVNGGASFNLKRGLNDFTSDVIGLDPKNQNNMFAASRTGGVARSTDRGNTWSLVNSGLSDTAVSAMDLRDGQNVLVGTLGGKVFRTSNGGNSWENSSAGLGNAGIVSVVMDKTNPNIAYIDTTYEGKGVYKSMDGGKSWVSKNKGMTVGTFLYGHPSKPNTLYAASYGGVYVTENGADTWSLFPSNGLGVLQVYLFMVNPAQENTFYAGTNRGLFAYGRTVIPGGPVIDQITPGTAKAGSAIVISGAGFGGSQGSNRVTFGSVDAGSAQSWSDTKISVHVPQSAQTGPVAVTAAGKQSNPVDFAVPSTSGRIVPSSGPAGTRVTLTLTSRPSSGSLIILFGNTLASEVTLSPPNVVTCVAPPGSGTVNVYAIVGVSLNRLGTFTYR